MSTVKKRVLYGFNREPKVRHSLYGVLITSLYLLLVGIPLYFGYMMKIIRQRANGDNLESPPKYRPLVPLMKDGGRVILLGLTSAGLPLLGTAIISRLLSRPESQFTNTEIGILSSILGILLIIGVIGSYIFLILLASYSISGDWKKCYNISLFKSIGLSRSYLKLYLKFMSVSLVAGLLANLMVSLTVILLIPSTVVLFLYMTTVASLIGDFAMKEAGKIESLTS